MASTALASAATICVARSRLVIERRRRIALRMRARSSACWTGLARKSSAPASSAATMSVIEVWAVMTITGRVAVSRIQAQPAAELEAVHARQVQVEQHQVRLVLDDGPQAALAVGRGDDFVALALQHARQQRPLGGLVLDDDDERPARRRHPGARSRTSVPARSMPSLREAPTHGHAQCNGTPRSCGHVRERRCAVWQRQRRAVTCCDEVCRCVRCPFGGGIAELHQHQSRLAPATLEEVQCADRSLMLALMAVVAIGHSGLSAGGPGRSEDRPGHRRRLAE